MSNAHIRRIQRRKRERFDKLVAALSRELEAEIAAMFGMSPEELREQGACPSRLEAEASARPAPEAGE
jgi:DNA-directed RNA polymerase specialized sigma subunit